jgi:hypothetical protein
VANPPAWAGKSPVGRTPEACSYPDLLKAYPDWPGATGHRRRARLWHHRRKAAIPGRAGDRGNGSPPIHWLGSFLWWVHTLVAANLTGQRPAYPTAQPPCARDEEPQGRWPPPLFAARQQRHSVAPRRGKKSRPGRRIGDAPNIPTEGRRWRVAIRSLTVAVRWAPLARRHPLPHGRGSLGSADASLSAPSRSRFLGLR